MDVICICYTWSEISENGLHYSKLKVGGKQSPFMNTSNFSLNSNILIQLSICYRYKHQTVIQY